MASIGGSGNEDDRRRCTKLFIDVKMSISDTWSFGLSVVADYASWKHCLAFSMNSL